MMIGDTVAWSEAARLCDRSRSAGEYRAVRVRPAPGCWVWVFFLRDNVSRQNSVLEVSPAPGAPVEPLPYLLICLAAPGLCCRTWDLRASSWHVNNHSWHVGSGPLTREGTQTPCTGSMEPQPLWAPLTVSFLAPHPLPSGLRLGTEGEWGTAAFALGLGR